MIELYPEPKINMPKCDVIGCANRVVDFIRIDNEYIFLCREHVQKKIK